MKTENKPRQHGKMPILIGVAFVIPALLLFSVFILYPLTTALGYSFFSWKGTLRGDFTGLNNYVTVFTKAPFDEALPNAFFNNLLLFAGAMVFQNSIGLALAVVLHKIGRVKRLFQTLFTLPYLVSPLVVGYLWSLMLSPLFGPVNATLKQIGLGEFAHPWLGDPTTAIWAIVFITAWQWIGFPMLLYGAALGGIPEEISEAAEIDGASGQKKFRLITFPLLLPALGTVSILTFIGAMESFPIPYAVGGSTGSPAGATDVMALLFYRTAFESGDVGSIGTSSALAMLLFLFIFGVAVALRTSLAKAERKLYD
jgi:raffinose/stachyose/melibiose transport system permease protein